MVNIIDKSKCCGCGACACICNVKAIKMESDEQGFLYPNIDLNKCVCCNKCNSVCPISNYKEEDKSLHQSAYLLQHKDKEILLDSTSGGAFSAIAESVIDLGGVVFGAKYDSGFNVVHSYVDNKKDLKLFRNSKYVQSNLRDCFKTIKRFIFEKRYVLFSGTPCQIEGLLNFLGENSKWLITCDVVCHGVPSPIVWRTYIDSLNDQNISNLRFRDKTKYGYLYSQFKIESLNNSYEGIEQNIMLRAFFSEICNRPSCYSCKFKKRYRRSDFTIWDCFDVNEFCKTNLFKQNLGISRMIVHSTKGKSLLNDILEKCVFQEISVENAIHYDAKEMFESVKKNSNYDEFWNSFIKNHNQTINTYFAPSLKNKLEETIRKISYFLGIYPFIRKIYKKKFGNRSR